MIVVSDASPVNILVRLGQINVLQSLFQRVVVPVSVAEELSRPATPIVLADTPLDDTPIRRSWSAAAQAAGNADLLIGSSLQGRADREIGVPRRRTPRGPYFAWVGESADLWAGFLAGLYWPSFSPPLSPLPPPGALTWWMNSSSIA